MKLRPKPPYLQFNLLLAHPRPAELHERNQAIVASAHMKSRMEPKAGHRGKALLAGLLRCRRCGRIADEILRVISLRKVQELEDRLRDLDLQTHTPAIRFFACTRLLWCWKWKASIVGWDCRREHFKMASGGSDVPRFQFQVGKPLQRGGDTHVSGNSFSNRLLQLVAHCHQTQLLSFVFESGHRIPLWISRMKAS